MKPACKRLGGLLQSAATLLREKVIDTVTQLMLLQVLLSVAVCLSVCLSADIANILSNYFPISVVLYHGCTQDFLQGSAN